MKLALALLLLFLAPSTAFATWSVIAVDVRTGQVIIASATCVRQAAFPQRQPVPARDLMDLQAVIVPGVGVAACQAGADNTRENQMLVYNELRKGTPPLQILELLKKDPNIERRQFGILAIPNGTTITAQNNIAGFNGSGNSQSSLYFGGQVGDFFYQVQGNTLLGYDVVHKAALAFTRAGGTLADRVMAAMEAADDNGGDKRCNCGNNPLEFVPCDNRTAHVAYIAIANKEDVAGVTHSDGKYYAYLSATDADIRKGESANPVKTLRMRYRAWQKAGSKRMPGPGPTLYRPGSSSPSSPAAQRQADARTDWQSLIALEHWREYQGQAVPAGWSVESGLLVKRGVGKDIVSRRAYADFELEFDWMLDERGNSGVFYRATEEYEKIYWSAPEYALLDDARHPDGRNILTSAGAAHSLYAPPRGVVKEAGRWNSTRIVVKGTHAEHRLNGQKVVEFDYVMPDFASRVAGSKFGRWPNFARSRQGLIGIQGDHGGVLSLRGLRIRELQ